MTLANSTKWTSSQLFECGKAKRHLMFITALLLVQPVGHVDPHITDWVTKPGQVPKEFELATYQFEYDALTYWVIGNTLHYMWQCDREMVKGFPRTCKREGLILKQRRPLNVIFTTPELGPASVSSITFSFWFGTLLMKKKTINKNKIVKAFKILK